MAYNAETLAHVDTYYRNAFVTRVIDGDTFEARVDLGFYVSVTERFRIKGINAPEIKGEERTLGLASKSFLEELILNQEIILCSTKQDGFRRYLADVFFTKDGVQLDVAQYLVDMGYAIVKNYH